MIYLMDKVTKKSQITGPFSKKSAKASPYMDAFALSSSPAGIYFIISTAIASSPLRKRVIIMQSILISDIFSSIRVTVLSISVFMAFSTALLDIGIEDTLQTLLLLEIGLTVALALTLASGVEDSCQFLMGVSFAQAVV